MRRSPLFVALFAALFAALAAVTVPAAAQNLLQNGRFDVDTSGWVVAQGHPGTIARNPADRGGFTGSGSLELTHQGANPSQTTVLLGECIAAAPGSYTLRAFSLVPAGQARTGSLLSGLYVFGGPNCSSGQLAQLVGPGNDTAGVWRALELQATLPPGTTHVRPVFGLIKNEAGGELKLRLDDVFLGKPCAIGPSRLCLDAHRFGVTVSWQTADGQSGSGVGTPFTGQAGYFWFFAPGNVEVVVKEIDGCPLNQRRWLFLSGLTNVKLDVTVTDYETNRVKVYSNPQGKIFAPVLDTAAFATCP